MYHFYIKKHHYLFSLQNFENIDTSLKNRQKVSEKYQ